MKQAPPLLACLFLGLAPLPAPAPPVAPLVGPQPNILIILLDDVGVEQIECFDSSATSPLVDPGLNLWDFEDDMMTMNTYAYAQTPNMTRLARRGVRFTRAFAAPTCSASRAQLLTGRYAFRNGIGHIVTPKGETLTVPKEQQQVDLSLDEVTLPEMLALSDHDYSAAWFAKWHVSRHPDQVPDSVNGAPGDDHPVLSGWPFFQGILQNPGNKPNPCSPDSCIAFENWIQVTSVANPAPGPLTAITSTEEITSDNVQTYITTRQREDLENWICAVYQDGPWCAVWAATAAHGPADGTPDVLTPSFGLDDIDEVGEKWNRFRACLEAFDKELGFLETNLDLEDPTIWANTVIFLMGDNGTDRKAMLDALGQDKLEPYAPTPQTLLSAGFENYRFKATPYKTGTNVPLIVAGPASVVSAPMPANTGRIHHGLVDIVDIWDTVRDIAGVDNSGGSALDTLLGASLVDKTIDGISFLNVLDGSSTTGDRTFSLAMDYRPNGLFCDRDGVRAGYTTRIGDKLYRLLRLDTATTSPLNEFYEVSSDVTATDQLAALTGSDPLEKTNLISPLPAAGPVLEAYCQALSELIGSESAEVSALELLGCTAPASPIVGIMPCP